MDEYRVRALLTRVVAEAPPPAPVDLDRVIELGEARLHDRTRWVIAAAAAVVLVVTVAITTLTLGGGSDRAAPPARPAAPVPVEKVPVRVPVEEPQAADPLPGTVPTRFDPGRSTLVLGEVPSSLFERGTAARSTALVFHASGGRQFLQVMVAPRGFALKNDLEAQAPSAATDGPVIQGRPSKWHYLGEDFGYLLKWTWAPDAQAYINVQGIPDQQALAVRLASTLSVNLNARPTLPFSLRAPYDFTLGEFQTSYSLGSGRRAPSATVVYGGPGPTFISVNANPLGTGIGAGNTTVDGRPAQVKDEHHNPGATYTSVVMATGDLKVTGTCNHRTSSPLSAGRFKDLCLSTTASAERLADLGEPATWPVFTPR